MWATRGEVMVLFRNNYTITPLSTLKFIIINKRSTLKVTVYSDVCVSSHVYANGMRAFEVAGKGDVMECAL